ncbi:hypothetical protein ACIQOV_29745 [Kitasatospora sp. NPDC091257]|uniref:hypothetical protein n=1 Tax=Kitasatospora sp. NPDC091257 TaxID=3364084 RepID=UPI0037FE75FE
MLLVGIGQFDGVGRWSGRVEGDVSTGAPERRRQAAAEVFEADCPSQFGGGTLLADREAQQREGVLGGRLRR